MTKLLNFPVNARDLYDAARIGTAFSTWIDARLRSNGYEPDKDFIVIESRSNRCFREVKNYFLTAKSAYSIAVNMFGSSRKKRALAFLDALMRTSDMPLSRPKGLNRVQYSK